MSVDYGHTMFILHGVSDAGREAAARLVCVCRLSKDLVLYPDRYPQVAGNMPPGFPRRHPQPGNFLQ